MTILMTKRMLGWAAAALLASGCIVTTDTDTETDDDGAGGSGASTGAGASGAGQPTDASQLFVVNNNSDMTSYVGAATLSGEQTPTTRLSLGAATSLFQPRAAVLTSTGRLLVARQNGGIVGYEDGVGADGDRSASLVVEGNNTGLGSPVALAYQGASDTLYVGAPQMDEGIIAFVGVSDADFDGDLAPSRVFGPTDRAPYDTDGTILMSVDALVLDTTGSLFVSDTSGLNVNNSRVLFYEDPAAQSGSSDPDAVITSVSWDRIEDMAIDAAGVLYVVDSTDTVFVFENADQLEGEVQPTRTITISLSGASLTGIALSSTGLGYLADDGNHAIYTVDEITTVDGSLQPDRSLEGFETRLRNPRKMFLLEPAQ